MFERFTDNARRVMQLANQEACRLRHEYIGTEHILLGLLKGGEESPNEAVQILNALGINLQKIKVAVEQMVILGPDMIIMGQLPQTHRSNKVIEYAMEEAHALNQNYVGAEHLLLGLLREEEDVVAQCLMNCGVKLDAVREKTISMVCGTPAEKTELEWERHPIPPSSIQQMKDAAGMSDTPNAEFVAWFSRLMNMLKGLRLVGPAQSYGEYLDSLKQAPAAIPTATFGMVNDRDPLDKEAISVVDPSWENGEDSMR